MEQTEQRVTMVSDAWFKHDGRSITPHDEFECSALEAEEYESIKYAFRKSVEVAPQRAEPERSEAVPAKRKYTRRVAAE